MRAAAEGRWQSSTVTAQAIGLNFTLGRLALSSPSSTSELSRPRRTTLVSTSATGGFLTESKIHGTCANPEDRWVFRRPGCARS